MPNTAFQLTQPVPYGITGWPGATNVYQQPFPAAWGQLVNEGVKIQDSANAKMKKQPEISGTNQNNSMQFEFYDPAAFGPTVHAVGASQTVRRSNQAKRITYNPSTLELAPRRLALNNSSQHPGVQILASTNTQVRRIDNHPRLLGVTQAAEASNSSEIVNSTRRNQSQRIFSVLNTQQTLNHKSTVTPASETRQVVEIGSSQSNSSKNLVSNAGAYQTLTSALFQSNRRNTCSSFQLSVPASKQTNRNMLDSSTQTNPRLPDRAQKSHDQILSGVGMMDNETCSQLKEEEEIEEEDIMEAEVNDIQEMAHRENLIKNEVDLFFTQYDNDSYPEVLMDEGDDDEIQIIEDI